MSVVFVLMGVAFQSLVAPLRSVLTLCLTLSFCFGFMVLVYQHGALNFMNLRAVSNIHATCWLPPVSAPACPWIRLSLSPHGLFDGPTGYLPATYHISWRAVSPQVMCFSIIVGLGLDYDVFLISRIYEYRLNGYTDRAAALKGIYKTGYIITAAGIIMAVAFGGLMISDELILNQAAFLLIVAVSKTDPPSSLCLSEVYSHLCTFYMRVLVICAWCCGWWL